MRMLRVKHVLSQQVQMTLRLRNLIQTGPLHLTVHFGLSGTVVAPGNCWFVAQVVFKVVLSHADLHLLKS